jgi:hypothetical protein
MLWILATDNHHNTIAADYLTVLTTRFHRGTHFHASSSSFIYLFQSSSDLDQVPAEITSRDKEKEGRTL